MIKVCICVPCYNEAKRLSVLVEQINTAFSDQPDIKATFYFLNDGSRPEEALAMRELLLRTKIDRVQIEFIDFPINRGKGAVLRDGFRRALEGDFDFIGFCDGDGATPVGEMIKLLRGFLFFPEKDLIIGSRWRALGYRVSRSLKRHISGRIFATLLSNLFQIPVYDSQCGAKIFRKQALSYTLLETCYDNKWLFDTQLLILLYKTGHNILEFPINWEDQADSKVSLLKDSWRMFLGLWKFRNFISKAP